MRDGRNGSNQHPEITEADLQEAFAFNQRLEEMLAPLPGVETLPAEATRRVRREGSGPFPPPVFLDEAIDISIDRRSGPMPVRVIRPSSQPAGIYIHIHGGGHTLGAHDMQDVQLKKFADETGMVVASIAYRLAPEYPYPAGPDDCEDAAAHLIEHGPDLLDTPRHFAIGGESAGAHLSVVTLLRLRDKHGLVDAIAGANLVYGGFDLTATPSARLWARKLVLSKANMSWFTENFVGHVPVEQRRVGDISPLFADLSGLPPALFTVGDADPLLDDSVFMAARWQSAGNSAELRVYPHGIHGFNAFPTALARLANQHQYQFVRNLATAKRAAVSV
jgi:acetyl esterase